MRISMEATNAFAWQDLPASTVKPVSDNVIPVRE